MAAKKDTEEVAEATEETAPPINVFLTVDLDGNYWWATRDENGELVRSDGPYADQQAAEEAARAAHTLERDDTPHLMFTVEEDQRVAEAPS